MAKPTPGPWVLDLDTFPDGGYAYVEAHTRRVALVDEARKADLDLIAAAPDLLAALQACDEAMEYMSEYDIPITLPEQVKAAIKKAMGE